ncbi:MAG: glycosyltransferase family 90 protein, partial [Bacteroidales bacterium]|nr:glycosyltransferase family 90 protein [Bacteroidales bacterium]
EPYLSWRKPKLNMYKMLQHKFIMVIEGNDVATSLKWVMASNSVAVMTKPNYETWFMEDTLIPNYHYIQVKDDYSDAVEKVNYYIANPDKAKAIVKNAHEYIDQFRNKKRERLISLMVMDKYFKLQND